MANISATSIVNQSRMLHQQKILCKKTAVADGLSRSHEQQYLSIARSKRYIEKQIQSTPNSRPNESQNYEAYFDTVHSTTIQTTLMHRNTKGKAVADIPAMFTFERSEYEQRSVLNVQHNKCVGQTLLIIICHMNSCTLVTEILGNIPIISTFTELVLKTKALPQFTYTSII